MDDRITREKLTKYGFSVSFGTRTEDYAKGALIVLVRPKSTFAYRFRDNELMDIGPISTMHEVEILDRIINPPSPDAITEEKLAEAGFFHLGEGVFNHEYIRLVPRTGMPRTYCVYYRTGDMIGLVVNMTEVNSLADVTSRRCDIPQNLKGTA